jgi:hypothetical protein
MTLANDYDGYIKINMDPSDSFGFNNLETKLQ